MNRKLAVVCAFSLCCILAMWQLNLFTPRIHTFALADNTEQKVIYLTFDDGPTDRITPKILDVLDEENVKATFFVIGINAERRPYLIEREYKSGHTVAVHSYTHRYNEIYSSESALLNDIARCNEVIHSVTGEYSSVYRFPGGSFNATPELVKTVCDNGYRYVDWNAGFSDAEILNASAEQLYKAAVTTSEGINHIVMLAHDSTTKTNTPEALRKVIKHFKEKGYSFGKF